MNKYTKLTNYENMVIKNKKLYIPIIFPCLQNLFLFNNSKNFNKNIITISRFLTRPNIFILNNIPNFNNMYSNHVNVYIPNKKINQYKECEFEKLYSHEIEVEKITNYHNDKYIPNNNIKYISNDTLNKLLKTYKLDLQIKE